MSETRESRNAVFSQQNPHGMPAGHAISHADKLKQDFGLEIPVELIPMPSGGKVYSSNSSLYLREAVEIRAMTTKEEDILTSRALLKKGTVITELIKSCLVDKTINTHELLSGDRNALMVAVRITGYGTDYNVELDCPSCNTKNKKTYDLAELPLRRLEIEPVSVGSNCFEYQLPYTKKLVRFRFLTGKDEEDIMATQEKQKKFMSNESLVTTNLAYSIMSIDGIEDRNKISNFVKSMPARDSLALRTYIKDHEPGILMKGDFECDSCGHESEVDIPIGVSFLWPQTRR
jgi:hypothetical protein